MLEVGVVVLLGPRGTGGLQAGGVAREIVGCGLVEERARCVAVNWVVRVDRPCVHLLMLPFIIILLPQPTVIPQLLNPHL